MSAVEVNFDGLVGPTHHYGGLGRGNLASQRHARLVSSPRTAALQGIAKMRLLVERGIPQGVLLPHERPHLPTLRRFGFTGSDTDVLARAFRRDPGLVSAVSSASAMWTANAATVSPSSDTLDGRVHLTPANLSSHLHRSIESRTTHSVLARYFADTERFVVHEAIPGSGESGDEGAANHTRLSSGTHDGAGVHLFVHGGAGGSTYRARQSALASAAIARQHGLDPVRTVFAQQSPAAIDAGVFHNDVIAVGDRDLLICHEEAYADQPATIGAMRSILGASLHVVTVPRRLLSLSQAVNSYLFNSQLVALPDGARLLLAPSEVTEQPQAKEATEWLLDRGVDEVVTLDLRQSMSNGGGPACLRLRVVLTPDELAAVPEGVIADSDRLDRLEQWVHRHYRDELALTDLADPSLLDEGRRALDELTSLLELGPIYEFQGP